MCGVRDECLLQVASIRIHAHEAGRASQCNGVHSRSAIATTVSVAARFEHPDRLGPGRRREGDGQTGFVQRVDELLPERVPAFPLI